MINEWSKPKFKCGEFVRYRKLDALIIGVTIHYDENISYFSPAWNGTRSEKLLKKIRRNV